MIQISPWGKPQTDENLPIPYPHNRLRGAHYVTTASHGGFMIAANVAKKLLSSEALQFGMLWNNYYCYEEDCACCIVFLEVPEFREKLYPNITRQEVLDSLVIWNKPYLNAIFKTSI